MKYILTLLFIPLFLSCSKDNKDVPNNPNNYKDLGITYHNLFKEEDDRNLIRLSDYELKNFIVYDQKDNKERCYKIIIELEKDKVLLIKYKDDIDNDIIENKDISGFLATYVKTYKLYEDSKKEPYYLQKDFYLTLKKPIGEKKKVHFIPYGEGRILTKEQYETFY